MGLRKSFLFSATAPFTTFVVEAFQSNGTDFGTKSSLPALLQGEQPNYYTFFKPTDSDANNGNIQKFHTGINTYVAQTDDIFFGLATTCGYKLTNTYNRRVVNVNSAIGATHMYSSLDGLSWNINVANNLTDRMINRFIIPAIKKNNSNGYDLRIVWVGGESDGGNLTNANVYQNNFQDVMDYVWIKFPNVKMHICQLKSTVTPVICPQAAIIRAANIALAANNPGKVFLIDTSGLTLRSIDNLHYDNASFQTLGDLVADSIYNN